MHWVHECHDCGGILTPDIEGLRHLYNVKTGTTIAWQKPVSDAPDDVLVGRFVFDSTAFDQAVGWLDDHLKDSPIKCMILDEVGPLELSGKGWDTWLRKALANPSEKEFILVVREGLVDKVVDHYELTEYEVVEKGHFMNRSTK